MPQLKGVVLGSNGWYDNEAGSTTSLLIKAPDFSIILDAGLGISRLEKYCDQSLPAFLFLSHSHLDHLFGLHVLSRFNFSAGLTIFGQKGFEKDVKDILKYPFSTPLDKFQYPLILSDETTKFPFTFELAELRHVVPTVGIRLKIADKIVSYIADTGLCDNCYKLAADADLLFTECAYPIGQPEAGDWPHLSPENGAKIAKQANAKRLVLVHFSPPNYPDKASRLLAQETARKQFPNSQAGYDGLEITI